MDQSAEIESAAVRLLATREHSRVELSRKLDRRFPADALAAVLDSLEQGGLLDDSRYAEQYAAGRVRKGYGPLTIRYELKQRGIGPDLIERTMEELEIDWFEQLRRVHDQKYGDQLPTEYNESARRGRFLTQRGFPSDMIRELLMSS